MTKNGDTTIIHYAANDYVEVSAKVFMENGELCFKISFNPLKKGYFSLGYMNTPASDTEQPMRYGNL